MPESGSDSFEQAVEISYSVTCDPISVYAEQNTRVVVKANTRDGVSKAERCLGEKSRTPDYYSQYSYK